MKKYRVYMDHGEAYGNLGDEAMLISAIERIKKYLGPCEFIIPRDNRKPLPSLSQDVQFVPTPRYVFRRTGYAVRMFMNIFERVGLLKRTHLDNIVWRIVDKIIPFLLPIFLFFPSKLSKTIKTLKNSDIFYGVGAADFNDFNLEDFVYKSWLYKIAGSSVKVTVVSSQGIGPLTIPWARKKLKEALEHVHILSFRDCCFSKSIVDEIKPKNIEYSIVGDEAFNLSVGRDELVNALLRGSGLPNDVKFISFHFRETDYTKKTLFLIPKVAKLLDEICKIVPHCIIFFPLSYDVHSTYDEQCGKKIKEHMSSQDRFLIAPLVKDVHIVKGAIGQAVYSLGLSYHMHVFALSQNRPSIILYSGEYYRYKSEGLLGFYTDLCRSFDLERDNMEEILKAVQEIEENYEVIVEKIASVNKKICEVNDWHIRKMISILSSKQ